MDVGVIFFLFLVLAGNEVFCDDAAASTAPPAAMDDSVLNTGICRKCKCDNATKKVDCQEQGLQNNFFSIEEWTMLKPFEPIEVDLSDNWFENVTTIAELPIQVLNLSKCGIEFIENASFKNLQKMRVLDLSHNKLTSALSPHVFEGRYSPEKYEPLESLRVLNLASNNFHSLNSDLFEHMPELTELNLSDNPFVRIDYSTLIALSSLPMLKILRMRSCHLSDIPEKMLHTPMYLERLDLSDNQLTAVPKELEETKSLMYLNLNQNPIRELDVNSEDYPGFPRLRKLKELHMCNMPNLKRIGAGAMGGLENLEVLHMSYNPELSEISPRALARADDTGETYVWPSIRELYLKSNSLREIDARLVSRWDLITKADVSDNPFVCDCTTQWMVETLVPICKNSSLLMTCAEPIEMQGLTMKHIHDNKSHMRCLDKYGHRPEKDGAILMGCLIGVLLAVPIMLTLMLFWRKGYFACIGLRGPVDVSRAFYKRAPDNDNFMS